jgi:hypothetical protein
MGGIYILLGVSALEGFVLGLLSVLDCNRDLWAGPRAHSALVLQGQDFWAAPGIAVIVGWLTCNQLSYLLGNALAYNAEQHGELLD